jgi:flagellar protein FliS
MISKHLDRYRTDGLASQSPQRLLVLLYQRLGADLQRAEVALLDGDTSRAHTELIHAQDIVSELRLALDLSTWSDGRGLAELYAFLEQRLVTANVTKSVVIVGECRQLVAPLAEAWEEAYRAVQAGRGEVLGTLA